MRIEWFALPGRLKLACVVAAAMVVATGCGGGGPPAPPAPAVPVPQITSVAPVTITAPARIVATGTNLDAVAQVRLGAVTLAIASQSPTSLALDVPSGAASGFLTLVDRGGSARASAQQITVLGSISVTSLVPSSVLAGDALTVTGSALDRVTALQFAGGATAPVISRSGSVSITVTVPAAAQSGPIVVLAAAGERVASAASLNVVPRIVVVNAGTFTVPPGGSVTLAGSGLTEVSGATIAGQPAAITARSATTIALTVPASVACGAISLLSSSQPAVFGGSVIVGAGCSVRIESIEFAQLLSQTTSDPRQRLVPRRETWVRAFVVSASSGQAAPVVRLTAFNGTTALGSLAMAGPSELPALAAGAALPGALRYSGGLAFSARLDDAWVGPGLRVQVTVDPDRVHGAPIEMAAIPGVGTGTRIDLVLVPLISGPHVPAVAPGAVALALDEITRRMPVAVGNLSVSLRQPYMLTTVTDGVDASGEWSSALRELERLRDQEAPNRIYYGLVRPMVTAGTAGIGYVNPVGSSSPALASLGWDTSRSNWLRTMTHELGHNFGRLHAPCGNPPSPDAGYPYPNGALGSTPLLDVLTDVIIAPTDLTDVMGYCGGRWFSDYNLREVQRFLETRPQAAGDVVAAAADAGADGPLLLVTGSIGLAAVQLAPLQAMRGQARALPQGEYLLRLRTVAGGIFDVPFDAVTVDHALPPERHFFVRVPDPGPLAAVEVLRGDSVIGARSADPAAAGRARATAAAELVEVVESADVLTLRWDALRYAFASVTHVGPAGRVVHAVEARGGLLHLSRAGLSGGTLEVSLSDGLNTRLLVIAR